MLNTILGGSTTVGTLFYMAPELIEGGSVDDVLPCDVYRYFYSTTFRHSYSFLVLEFYCRN